MQAKPSAVSTEVRYVHTKILLIDMFSDDPIAAVAATHAICVCVVSNPKHPKITHWFTQRRVVSALAKLSQGCIWSVTQTSGSTG